MGWVPGMNIMGEMRGLLTTSTVPTTPISCFLFGGDIGSHFTFPTLWSHLTRPSAMDCLSLNHEPKETFHPLHLDPVQCHSNK